MDSPYTGLTVHCAEPSGTVGACGFFYLAGTRSFSAIFLMSKMDIG